MAIKKYRKGDQVRSIIALQNAIKERRWFYIGNRSIATHWSWISNQSLSTLQRKINCGQLHYADRNADAPYVFVANWSTPFDSPVGPVRWSAVCDELHHKPVDSTDLNALLKACRDLIPGATVHLVVTHSELPQ